MGQGVSGESFTFKKFHEFRYCLAFISGVWPRSARINLIGLLCTILQTNQQKPSMHI
jgi:hypothetical protein